MKHQTGMNVSRKGLYRCGDCGEAQEYHTDTEFGRCDCSMEDGVGENWILVEEY